MIGKQKILIVDDEKDLLIMTKSIFKNGHFTNAHLFELLKNT